MGAITDFLNGFDRSKKEEDEARQHLETLSAFAETKVEYFTEKLKDELNNAGMGTDKTIPIDQIEDWSSETHAYVSANADKISKTVTDAVQGFVQGGKENITDGICKLLTTAISMLFGSEEGNEATIDKHYVCLHEASLVRLDVKGWKRKITSQSIKTRVEQVSAFVMSRSSISLEGVHFNTFLDYYQAPILAENPDANLDDIIKEAKKLYKEFTSEAALS